MPTTADLPPETKNKGQIEYHSPLKYAFKDQTQGYFSIDPSDIEWPNEDTEVIFEEHRNTKDVLSELEKFDNDILDHLDFVPSVTDKTLRKKFNEIVNAVYKLNPQQFSFTFTDQLSIDFKVIIGDSKIYLDYYLPIISDDEVSENAIESLEISVFNNNKLDYKWGGKLEDSLPLLHFSL